MTAVHPEERRPIKVVLIDAKHTLFLPKSMSRQQFFAYIFHKVTRRPVLDPDRLWFESRRIRLHIDTQMKCDGLDGFNTREYWVENNRKTAEALGISITDEEAWRIHEMIVGDTDLYMMSAERISFLDWLRKSQFPGCMIVVASNSPSKALEQLLARYKIATYFNRVYTPDVLRASKPQPAFFEEILAFQDNVPPQNVLMIGNSPFTDLGAKDVGINTVLITDKREGSEVKGTLISGAVTVQTVGISEVRRITLPPPKEKPIVYATRHITHAQRFIFEQFVGRGV